MSDEDLFYTPGSIYNSGRDIGEEKRRAAEGRLLDQEIRALYAAVLSGDPEAIRKAQSMGDQAVIRGMFAITPKEFHINRIRGDIRFLLEASRGTDQAKIQEGLRQAKVCIEMLDY